MDITTLFDYALATVLIIFAAYFYFDKLKLIHKRIIAFFLLIEATYLISSSLFETNIVVLGNHSKSLLYCAESLLFLLSPLVYMLTKSILNPKYTIRLKHGLHAIPCILLVAFPFIYTLIVNKLEKEIIYIQDIYSILFLVQFPIYLISALSYIKLYGKMRHTHRKIKHDDRVKWLQIILVSFFVSWIFNTAYNTFLTFSGQSEFFLFLVYAAINMAAFGLMIFMGLHFGNIFNISPISRKFHYSYLTDEEKRRYLEDLHVYVQVKKPYSGEEISLNSAAGYLNIRPHLLAKILNEKLHKTFDQYIISFSDSGNITEFN